MTIKQPDLTDLAPRCWRCSRSLQRPTGHWLHTEVNHLLPWMAVPIGYQVSENTLSNQIAATYSDNQSSVRLSCMLHETASIRRR